MKKILHISPVFPPKISGVGDYASILSHSLQSQSLGSLHIHLGTRDNFVSPPQNNAPKYLSSTTGILKAISEICPDAALIHYVGYGYSPKGIPFWLLLALLKMRKNSPGIHVVTMFHELYASGMPWQSAFWLSPLQRFITAGIARLTDAWVTNYRRASNWLERYAGNKPNCVMPVFSNVGEARFENCKSSRMVVFGGSNLRQEAYEKTSDRLFDWAQANGVEIHDIGPEIRSPSIQKRLAGVNAKIHGIKSGKEISQILKDARYGLISYPIHCVGKSGAFAALCAHGVMPVLLSDCYESTDGLEAGKHYLTELPRVGIENLNGQNAWHWYQNHTLAIQSQKFAELLSLS